METALRDRFIESWEKHFPGAELPVAIEFRDGPGDAKSVPAPGGWRCLICQLGRARNGMPLVFDEESVTCQGGLRYGGFSERQIPGFRYFLSSGSPGAVEGERYKRTPEIVDAWLEDIPEFPPHGKYLHVTRWDRLTEEDRPEVVVFFARPEVLSGLFTLANFDRAEPNGVICPMGAGCSSIIFYPLIEQQQSEPRVVLGMFDPSARKCVPLDVLTMAFPMKRFEQVVGYMEESFLITKDCETVRKKIERYGAGQ